MRSALLILVFVLGALASGPQEIVGKYQCVGKPGSCVMKLEDGKVQGYIIGNAETPSMIGMHLFRDLLWNEEKQRWEGFVFDEGRDKLWKGNFKMPDKDTFLMIVRWMGIGQTDRWVRIQE